MKNLSSEYEIRVDPAGEPIKNIYKTLYADASADNTPYHRDYFRASEVGHCRKRIYLSMSGSTPSMSTLYGLMVRGIGDKYHHIARDYLRKAGYEVYNEEDTWRKTVNAETEQAFDIKCRIDGRIRLRAGGSGRLQEDTPALLEVKSFSVYYKSKFEKAFERQTEEDGDGYRWLKEGSKYTDFIWQEYYDQTQISLYICNLPYAYYFPIFRDSGWVGFNGKGLLMPRDEGRISAIILRMGRLYKEHYKPFIQAISNFDSPTFTGNYIEEKLKHLPMADYKPDSRECSFCQHWGDCWGDQGLKRQRKNEDLDKEILE